MSVKNPWQMTERAVRWCSTWRRMLMDSSLEVGTFCSAAPSRVNSVRRHDACAGLITRVRRRALTRKASIGRLGMPTANNAEHDRHTFSASKRHVCAVRGRNHAQFNTHVWLDALRALSSGLQALCTHSLRTKYCELKKAHVVIDVPLVAELLVSGRVDQHLVARGGRAVRDDLGAQVHIALVERCQC